ncbi:FAD-dependent oxidoreductase [Mucilaginibacter limnophilus]|uniref:FAD-dependent oxidoreductase n=1 Tax=Mucilaginibacter limnophilus TaxID=1932778 RepID=A0A3S2URX1_9SPHI|nr:FAD-dependent oxidoreductase [Mucilaginibacter limnophilus]
MNDFVTTSARDGSNKSLWQEAAATSGAETFDLNTIYDVLIVGGGITGITAAILLQKQGKKVILAEAHSIGFGTTGGTTSHLNTFFDTPYPQIESDFGEDGAKLVAKAGKETLDLIASLVTEYSIDCDFQYKDGYLFSQNEKETKQLDEILASSQKVGIDATESNINGVPLQFDKAVVFKGQAQFHPLKYINKLAEVFVQNDGVILNNTFINDLKKEGEAYTATDGSLNIKASQVFYATHMPPGINISNFTCAPYRSYVIGVTLKDNNYPDCLSYDMKEPYHYFRTHEVNGQKYLIVGGEDHKTGHGAPEQSFAALEEYVRGIYNVYEVAYKWSSQYYEPADGLPYIGKMPLGGNDVFMATGYSGNGIIFGSLSARIITDLICGIENPYEKLFSPSRIKPVAGFTEFVKENADVAWKFIADRFSSEDIDSLNELKAGDGMIAKYKGDKVAVYKDEQGTIHALSPVCTHAKCIVSFNPEEKSWDCPCHGGRFSIDGKVLTGPPQHDLQKIDVQ